MGLPGFSAGSGRFRQGQWVLHHGDEIIATYFIPLAEPLGLPQHWFLPSYERVYPPQVDSIKAIPGFILRPLSEDATTDAPPGPDGEFPLDSNEVVWSNKGVLRSSVMLHRVSGNFVTRASLDAAQAVADRATAGKYKSEEVEKLVVGFIPPSSTSEAIIRDAMAAGVGEMTIAEVAVPLHVIGAIPGDLDAVLSEHADRPHAPGLPGQVDWMDFTASGEADEPNYRDVLSQRALAGLHLAIAHVRRLQSAYHIAARSPTTLMTFERLPPIIPISFRHLAKIGTAGEGVVVSVPIHRNLWAWLAPADLSEEQEEGLSEAIRRADRMAYASFLDLRREASVAFQREGDTRAAAVYAGLAAEVLLDELLQQLLWEEKLTPEQAEEAWKPGLLTRVKNDYGPRIGGSWSIVADTPVGRWSRNCADLRHRAVHGGYLPTYAEVEASLVALDELLTFLCDRLSMPKQLGAYPRTALSLVGPPGLKRRSQYSRRIRELQASTDEPNWDDTFDRWKEVLRKRRRGSQGMDRTPVLAESDLVGVLLPGGGKYFTVVHPATGLAAKVEIDRDAVEPGSPIERLVAAVDGVTPSQLGPDAFSVGTPEFNPSRVRVVGDWVESYHLVPLAGVMVDRSDFSA
jgi:hypothetical protein